MEFSPTLLITDDDRAFRETLRDVFEPQGFQTHLAADGQEAVEIVEKRHVHLVLIDMHMPRLTGLEAIDRIHQLRQKMPCILISGQLDEQIRQQAQAFDVLDKPVNVKKVRQSVMRALKLTYGWSGVI